jgi:hypothetical protein
VRQRRSIVGLISLSYFARLAPSCTQAMMALVSSGCSMLDIGPRSADSSRDAFRCR